MKKPAVKTPPSLSAFGTPGADRGVLQQQVRAGNLAQDQKDQSAIDALDAQGEFGLAIQQKMNDSFNNRNRDDSGLGSWDQFLQAIKNNGHTVGAAPGLPSSPPAAGRMPMSMQMLAGAKSPRQPRGM